MADKRISQLVERTDIANNDVVPIVASGATTTNKATISSIQEFMQENLDLGVTSVGITLGTTGTDVSVSGSPITTSGNITINLPTASATNRGLLSAADWTTFNNKQPAGNYVTLDTAQTITAQKTFTTSGSSDSVIISHGSGSGFALDVIKAGNGEAIRVTKTSGSGNAMSITGGNFGAEAATFSGVVTTTPDAVINGVNVGRGGGNATENTRLGNSALSVNTTGTGNTAAGSSALSKNTTGGGNTAVGTQALQENTTGEGNTAVGQFSLIDNTTGLRNSALGYLSLSDNTTGIDNVGIGFFSLFTNTTGSDNTALGHNSGSYIADGSTTNSITNNSIYIGSDTKALANNQTNQIVIGHNAIGNGSNTVTIGNDSITSTFLKGNINLKGANNTTKAIEFANSAGLIHWTIQNPFGAAGEQGNFQIRNNVLGSLALNISPSSNIITLTGALNGTSAIFTGSITSYDTLVSRTLTNTTPSLLLSRNNANNGFGVIRILDGGTISFENGPTGATQTSRLSLDGTTGLATFTGALNGTSASFTGAITLSNNQNAPTTISISNTTAGTGSQSTFSALSDSNAGVANFGKYSSLTTPYKILGSSSAFIYTDKGNISILNDNTSGSILLAAGGSSTAHLTLASTGAATFSSSVTIGASDDILRFGNLLRWGFQRPATDNRYVSFVRNANATATPVWTVDGDNGNIGIGTASPSGQLHIKGSSGLTNFGTQMLHVESSTDNYSGIVFSGTNGSNAAIRSEGASTMSFWTASGTSYTERMRITSGGALLVNQQTLSAAGAGTKMQVATDMLTTGSLAGYFFENRSGGVTASTNWYGWYANAGTIFLFNGSANAASINPATGVYTPLSDVNKKKDFEYSTIGLNEILNLKPTLYRMESDESEGEKELGFIAQEVKEFIPQAYVESGEEDAKFIGLNYNAIVAALVKSVQELKTEIDSLKNQIK